MSEDADNRPSWPPLRMRGRRGSLEGKSQIAVQCAAGREAEARREGEVARGRQAGQPAGVGVEELEPQGQTALQDREATPRKTSQSHDQVVPLGPELSTSTADDRLLALQESADDIGQTSRERSVVGAPVAEQLGEP
ncbi:hypothetical protein ACWCXX_37695 [Streptomyces sp. NPDC001732]